MVWLKKRGTIDYLHWYEGTKRRERSLKTRSLQLATARLSQFGLAQAQGVDNPFPTEMPLPDLFGAYVRHIRLTKRGRQQLRAQHRHPWPATESHPRICDGWSGLVRRFQTGAGR